MLNVNEHAHQRIPSSSICNARFQLSGICIKFENVTVSDFKLVVPGLTYSIYNEIQCRRTTSPAIVVTSSTHFRSLSDRIGNLSGHRTGRMSVVWLSQDKEIIKNGRPGNGQCTKDHRTHSARES